MPEQLPSKIGRYHIVGVVGRWERGWRYRGRDDLLGRDVLIKTWSQAGVVDTAALLARFRQAIHQPMPLDVTNIIRTLEFGESEGVLYTVFEWLEGESLMEAMQAGINLRRGLPIILQALDGLAAIHAAGIVHRNITPANIFIQEDGPVKITGFGQARSAHTVTADDTEIVGTADYMSPEVIHCKPVDPRSDLFSVGCVLFELVTGRRPFHSGSLAAIFYKMTHDEPEYALLPSDPEWERLRDVIMRALQKTPEDRYPDAGAMRADLDLALEELGGSADWMPPSSREAAETRLH